MKDDLISRSAALRNLESKRFSTEDEWTKLFINTITLFLNQQQSVDAVEVVRCKECTHSKILRDTPLFKENPWKYYRSDCRICGCHELIGDEFIIVDDDFFCKYGKRKESKDARDQRHISS